MKTKHFWKIFAVFVVLIIAGGFFYIFEKVDESNLRSINVQGTQEEEFVADRAVIGIGVQEKTDNIATGNEKVKVTLDNLKKALESLNVELETTNYNVRENMEWDEETRKYTSNGYVVSSSLIVTVKDTEQISYILTAIIDAGTNRVDYLNYELDEAHLEEIKLDLYAKAAKKAKDKADAIAIGSGEEVYKLQHISESSGYYPIYRAELASKDIAMAITDEDSAGSGSSNFVFENEIPVSVTVSASYLLK